ncbi:MAG: cytochrome c nitrite reductase small subunit [Prolixibacteraceae bacterium]|nr:cytochrome c nitrite reductase small subunit [Prolixibacteraceae bacterium]
MLKILLPPGWRLPVAVISGLLIGLMVFTLYLSKAHSYLSDEPQTCTNCHIMAPQYATWSHSSHREVTHCNDCHVPHNNFVNKYYFKAKDGLRHATIFTLRKEPQVIFIKEEGAKAVHNNCIRCHSDLLTDPKLQATIPDHGSHRTDRKCNECHREIPHGRVNSLSSVPYARVPFPQNPVPQWLKKDNND